MFPDRGRGGTMPFALYCSVCNEPFTFFENIANRALQRCNACDQRLRAYQEDTLAWIVQAFEKPAGVSEEMEHIIYDQLEAFHLPLDLEAPITAKLSYLRLLSKIRGGDFPHVQIPNHLDTDEYAHFEIKATHVSRVGQKVKEVPGQLIGTNKKAYFIADSGKGGATLSWNNLSKTRAEEVTV